MVKEWRAKNGVTVHLTAYGENLQTSDILQRIKMTGKDVLVIVGSRKVLSGFFTEAVSDFNVAVGNQPIRNVQAWLFFSTGFLNVRSFQKILSITLK